MTYALLELAEQIEALCAENQALRSLLPYLEHGDERFLKNLEVVQDRVRGRIVGLIPQEFPPDELGTIIEAMNESLQLIREQIGNF